MSSVEPTNPFSTLPPEMVQTICRFIPAQSLVHFALQNRESYLNVKETMLQRAQTSGYEGTDPFEGQNYRIARLAELRVLKRYDLFPNRYCPCAKTDSTTQMEVVLGKIKRLDLLSNEAFKRDMGQMLSSSPSIMGKLAGNVLLSAARAIIFYRADPNQTNEHGETLLQQAMNLVELNRHLIFLLLIHGADPNKAHLESGQTPLTLNTSDPETTKLLLKAGAKPNHQTASGCTALHFAVKCAHTETVRILLKHQADPDLTNQDGATPDQLTQDPEIQELFAVTRMVRNYNRYL